MFDTMCRFGEVTGKLCYPYGFLGTFATVRQNVTLLKHWPHQIVRFKNRRICKNLVFARSVLGLSTIIH